MNGKYLEMYRKFHVLKDYELLGLFSRLRKIYAIDKVFYPGAYVHITPALVFPTVVFNDVYKKLLPFYASDEIITYIIEHKTYPGTPNFRYICQDYNRDFPLEEESFDLLISQYSGFVSSACKKYLKIGGILVANNSHGDAGMAHLMPGYEFIAVMNHSKSLYSHSSKNLDEYFIPKTDKFEKMVLTEQVLKDYGKGIGYTKSASHYVFRRIN